jgi:hypothetical protein
VDVKSYPTTEECTLGPRAGAEGGAEAIVRLAADLANIDAMIRLGLVAPDPSAAIGAATWSGKGRVS